MKKVVAKLTIVPEISLNSVSTEKYYGFQRNDGAKGFLTSLAERPDMLLLAVSGLTGGNSWNHLGAPTVQETIKNMLDKQVFEVYEFDTPQKLFKWLAE